MPSTHGTTSATSRGNLLQLSDLVGLIPTEVGETLAKYAAQVPSDQAIVEIGSYKGKSTCYLASQAKAHVWAIDAWDLPGNEPGRFHFNDAFADFVRQTMAMNYSDRITPIRGYGPAEGRKWIGPLVGLLFIDGDHSYKAVRSDVEAWIPNLAHDAVVILDDLDTPKNPGVRKAAAHLSYKLGLFTVEAERLAIWKR